MTEFAKLSLVVDAAGMVPGEQALDQIAKTGARTEGALKLNTKNIEQAMARLGGSIGNLGGVMKSLESVVAQSMGRSAQEAQKSARTFDELRRAIDPAFGASQRFAEVQRELAAFVQTGAASQRAANEVLEIARSRYLGVATAAEQAEKAQREQAQAIALATGNYHQLRASLDPIYASSKRYESAIETADAALKAKIITEIEHARVLQMAAARLNAVAPAAASAGAATNKFGMVANQIGYQIQDVFVSGPMIGWLRAIAQQAPQAAGAFSMLGGSLGTVIPWVGTAVAVGAALLPMFMTAGREAKTTEEAIEELTGSLEAYKEAVTNALMPMDELWKKFGEGAQAARETYAAMVEIERIQYFKEMSVTVATLTGDLRGITSAVQEWQAATQMPDFMRKEAIAGASIVAQALANGFGLTVVEANRVSSAIEAFKAASDAGPREAARASRDLGDQLMRAYEATGRTNGGLLGSAERAYQFAINAQEADRALGDADAAAAGATSSTQNWAMAMAGVRAEIIGIASALSQIGGGMISNAAKFVEINALKAGRSVADARIEVEKFNVAAKYDSEIMAASGRGPLGWVEAQALKAARSLELAGIAASTEADALRKSSAEAERASTSKGKSGAASTKVAREAERLAGSLDKEAQKWAETLDPMRKYRNEMAELNKLTGRLSSDQMAEAQKRLNLELVNSLPLAGEFVDTMSEGLLNGFSGTLSSLTGMFKKWLAEMIATAWKNRIVVGMGLGDGMASGAAAAPVGGIGGVMGGLGAGAGALAGGIMSGASGFLTAAGGGFGSAATYTSFMLKGATSSLAGFGSALGAIALPLAAVVGVFSFFRKKVKELDAGLRVTVDGINTLVEQFRKTETKRFWGLSKKVRTSYEAADKETQDALSRAVGTLQDGVLDAAKVLGFGAGVFTKFSHVLQVSTKGMTEEEAIKAVQDALAGLGDSFAGMIPGLKALAKDGEGASDALLRLSQALVGVNGIMDTLGHKFRASGLSGADKASQIADAFGGLDAMATATQAYYETFYSESERLTTTTRQTRAALADLGIAMPKTRAEYRGIIEALDLNTKKGREAYATLIGLGAAFDAILPQISTFTKQMMQLQGMVQTGLEGAISAAEVAAKANAAAAADWYKAAGSIRQYMDKFRGTASALFNPQQALTYNRGQYNATYKAALGGDLSAAQNVTGAADRYLDSVLATAKSREQAALAQAKVLSQLGLLQGVADIEGARHDVIAGLLNQQIGILTDARDYLANGGVLTDKMIATLEKKLNGLDGAIKAAELINYKYLKERLAVTVDVIADANIPAHVKALLANASTGVEGFVDFIVRSDLAPDMKWLALARTSEHLKQIKYLAQNDLGADYTKLALKAGSRYQVNVLTALEKGGVLDTDQLRKLMAGTASGKITLGGSFKFDPSQGFATWYETASKTAISMPMSNLKDAMGALRVALGNLKDAIAAETKRQQDAIDAVNDKTGKPAVKPDAKPDPTKPKTYSLTDYGFTTLGIGGSNGMGDRTTITGPLGGTRSFRSPLGGSRSQAEAWLKAQKYPAFARGGNHFGGLRIVGEQGPELEATGPSRIFTAQQTRQMLGGDNASLVAELQALRQEMAEVKAHVRKTAESTTSTDKTLRRVDALGVKIDPDQNKVTS